MRTLSGECDLRLSPGRAGQNHLMRKPRPPFASGGIRNWQPASSAAGFSGQQAVSWGAGGLVLVKKMEDGGWKMVSV